MTPTNAVVGTAAKISLKIFLQGAYDASTGMMYDSLRMKNLIPLTDPYRSADYSAKFTHKMNAATQATTPSVLAVTGVNAIVDWVFVELHDATTPSKVIATVSALVQRDGDVVSAADGISPVQFDSISSGNYYIAIRHRNHLGTMTATTQSLTATTTVVDFTTLTNAELWNKTAGDGFEQANVGGSKKGLWAGNANVSRDVIFTSAGNDADAVFFRTMTEPTNTDFLPNYIINPSYAAEDINMDGKVIYQSNNSEIDMLFFIVLTHPNNTSFLPIYIVVEQLP
jgi:hypothetical protein